MLKPPWNSGWSLRLEIICHYDKFAPFYRVECTPYIRITLYLSVKHILGVKHKHIHIFPYILTFMKILVLSILILGLPVIGYLISFY